MGIIKRFRDIASANIHDLLDKLEDPVAMLDQYLRDMESEIQKAEEAVSRQTVMEKKWEHLIEEMEARAKKRERQAQLAVEAGEDDIARQAIADKQFCEKRLAEYRAQLEETSVQKRVLLKQLLELKDKYADMRNKKWNLIARVNVASASKQINDAMCSIDTESAAKGFARIEERVIMMEAEADASRNIRKAYRNDHGTLVAVKTYSDEVEAELTKLKESNRKLSQSTEMNTSVE